MSNTNAAVAQFSTEQQAFIDCAKKLTSELSHSTSKSLPPCLKVPAFDVLRYSSGRFHGIETIKSAFENLTPSDYRLLFAPPVLAATLSIIFAGTKFVITPVQVWELIAIFVTWCICDILYKEQTSHLEVEAERLENQEKQNTGMTHGELNIARGTERLASGVRNWLVIAMIFFVAYIGLDDLIKWIHAVVQPAVITVLQNGAYAFYVTCLLIATWKFQRFDFEAAQDSPVHEQTLNCVTSFLFASVPIFIAAFVLTGYVWATTILSMYLPGSIDIEAMHTFVGGALAFQMLISNITFVLILRSFLPRVVLVMSSNTFKVEAQ